MLDDGIHLELLGVTAVEEAEHIVQGNASVEDGATNEEVGSSCQFELATVVEHRADLTGIGGVNHIDAVVLEAKNLPHPCLNVCPGREILFDKAGFPGFDVGLPVVFVGVLLDAQKVEVGVLGLEERFTNVLDDAGDEFLLPFVVFLVDFHVDEAG